MAESRIARPYAQAIFDTAKADGDLAGWSDKLDLLAGIAADNTIQEMIGSPRVTSDQLAETLVKIAGDKVGAHGQNLIRLLARNRRVGVLSDIKDQYERLRAESEQTVEAELITAQEVTEAQIKSLSDALARRLGRQVKLESRVDPELMGGAIIKTGDLVIDGSLTTKLTKLNSVLTQ